MGWFPTMFFGTVWIGDIYVGEALRLGDPRPGDDPTLRVSLPLLVHGYTRTSLVGNPLTICAY